jgi:hypothetical protein
MDPMDARRYLRHVGLPYDALARAPPRSGQRKFEFEPFPDDLPDYHHALYCDEFMARHGTGSVQSCLDAQVVLGKWGLRLRQDYVQSGIDPKIIAPPS